MARKTTKKTTASKPAAKKTAKKPASKKKTTKKVARKPASDDADDKPAAKKVTKKAAKKTTKKAAAKKTAKKKTTKADADEKSAAKKATRKSTKKAAKKTTRKAAKKTAEAEDQGTLFDDPPASEPDQWFDDGGRDAPRASADRDPEDDRGLEAGDDDAGRDHGDADRDHAGDDHGPDEGRPRGRRGRRRRGRRRGGDDRFDGGDREEDDRDQGRDQRDDRGGRRRPEPRPAKTEPGPDLDGAFKELFAQSTPDVMKVAKALREIVREVMPDAEETVFARGWKVALYSDPVEVCGIQPVTGRCNFYLSRGAQIPDPHGILEGVGQNIRHVKVRVGAEIPTEAIADLIREGQALARSGEASA